MPVATLQRLVDLGAAGATILMHEALPEDVPGYGSLAARRERFQNALRRLSFEPLEGSSIRQAALGRGRVLLGDDLSALLAAADVPREELAQLGVRFARRKHAEGYHYFLANLGDETVDQWVRLATPAESVVLMDPRTAATGLGKTRQANGHAELYLQLAPGESLILRTFDRNVAGPRWRYLEDDGEPIAIEGTWHVEFIDGGPVLPAPLVTKELVSWTTLGDEEARRFAGTARYTIDFALPPGEHDDWLLDLGSVRESARVRLNGHQLGTLWHIPFCTPVGKHLRPDTNRLEVDVTNLSANRIRELDRRGVKWRIFHDINFVTHEYKEFNASKWPLMDSGLLGPVMLRPMKEKSFQAGSSAH
jgi:hypothetical protein